MIKNLFWNITYVRSAYDLIREIHVLAFRTVCGLFQSLIIHWICLYTELLINYYSSPWDNQWWAGHFSHRIICRWCARRKHYRGNLLLCRGINQLQPQILSRCLWEDGTRLIYNACSSLKLLMYVSLCLRYFYFRLSLLKLRGDL